MDRIVKEKCLICNKSGRKIYTEKAWGNPPKKVFKVCNKCKAGLK